MYDNLSCEYLVKTLINIIRVMQNIGFTTSPESTIITLEKLGGTVEKRAHEFSTIGSQVSDGLLIFIVSTH